MSNLPYAHLVKYLTEQKHQNIGILRVIVISQWAEDNKFLDIWRSGCSKDEQRQITYDKILKIRRSINKNERKKMRKLKMETKKMTKRRELRYNKSMYWSQIMEKQFHWSIWKDYYFVGEGMENSINIRIIILDVIRVYNILISRIDGSLPKEKAIF